MPFNGKSLGAQTNELLGPGPPADGWLIMSQTVEWDGLIFERLHEAWGGLEQQLVSLLEGKRHSTSSVRFRGHNLTVHHPIILMHSVPKEVSADHSNAIV